MNCSNMFLNDINLTPSLSKWGHHKAWDIMDGTVCISNLVCCVVICIVTGWDIFCLNIPLSLKNKKENHVFPHQNYKMSLPITLLWTLACHCWLLAVYWNLLIQVARFLMKTVSQLGTGKQPFGTTAAYMGRAAHLMQCRCSVQRGILPFSEHFNTLSWTYITW